jgi:pimeloyl-ACP methyl ester carboxylesterase
MVVAAMPGARSEAIPGATHDPQVTHPGPYAQLIESHLRATVARR